MHCASTNIAIVCLKSVQSPIFSTVRRPSCASRNSRVPCPYCVPMLEQQCTDIYALRENEEKGEQQRIVRNRALKSRNVVGGPYSKTCELSHDIAGHGQLTCAKVCCCRVLPR